MPPVFFAFILFSSALVLGLVAAYCLNYARSPECSKADRIAWAVGAAVVAVIAAVAVWGGADALAP